MSAHFLVVILIAVAIGGVAGLVFGLLLRYDFRDTIPALATVIRFLDNIWWLPACYAVLFGALAIAGIIEGLWAQSVVIGAVAVMSLAHAVWRLRHPVTETANGSGNLSRGIVAKTIALLLVAACVTGATFPYLEWILRKNPHPFCAMSGTQLEKTWVMLLLCHEQARAAVWCDIDFSVPGSAAGVPIHPPRQERGLLYNSIRSADGRYVEWTVDAKNGEPKDATINGKEYQLDEGTLFLVRTHHGTRVTQLHVDLKNESPFSRKTWDRLAKENPEIRKFMAEADKPR